MKKEVFNIQEILLFLSVVVAGISLILFVISLISFKRINEVKLLFISLAFLFFFIKTIVFLFIKSGIDMMLFDLIIIALLYVAAAKK
ncbi:MAG: hypothetical protein J7J36_05150 [Thermoplasmata archaeon]|nr:hypothetical protein [Thermoplasmata archaeon]